MPRRRPRLRAAEVFELTGHLGIRLVEYMHEDWTGPQRGAPDLDVDCVSRPLSAEYHAGSGIYGFLRVPSGPLRVHVTDPGRRYLPRAHVTTVRTVGGSEELPKFETLVVRPAYGKRIAPGETAVRGHIADDAPPHTPYPFARVEVEARPNGGLPPRRYVTYSDLQGRFLVPLRDVGHAPDEDDLGAPTDTVPDALDASGGGASAATIQIDIVVKALLAPIPDSDEDPLSVLPADFEGSSAAWSPSPAATIQDRAIDLGRINHLPILISAQP